MWGSMGQGAQRMWGSMGKGAERIRDTMGQGNTVRGSTKLKPQIACGAFSKQSDEGSFIA